MPLVLVLASHGAETPLTAPTGLGAVRGASIVTLSWNANTEPNLLGYNVYRSLTAGGVKARRNASVLTSPGYTDITNDALNYYYQIRAVSVTGKVGLNSLELVSFGSNPGTTLPVKPTGLTAGPVSGGVLLDWNNNVDAGLLGYNVYRSGTQGVGHVRINVSTVATSTYTDTTVLVGTFYFYMVRALTAAGEGPFSSEVTGSTTILAPPAPPANVTAARNPDGSVLLNWNDSLEAGFIGYDVFRSSGGSFTKINTTHLIASTYTDAAAPVSALSYKVAGFVTGEVRSADSAIVSVSPVGGGTVDPPTPPADPAGTYLSSITVNRGTVAANWRSEWVGLQGKVKIVFDGHGPGTGADAGKYLCGQYKHKPRWWAAHNASHPIGYEAIGVADIFYYDHHAGTDSLQPVRASYYTHTRLFDNSYNTDGVRTSIRSGATAKVGYSFDEIKINFHFGTYQAGGTRVLNGMPPSLTAVVDVQDSNDNVTFANVSGLSNTYVGPLPKEEYSYIYTGGKAFVRLNLNLTGTAGRLINVGGGVEARHTFKPYGQTYPSDSPIQNIYYHHWGHEGKNGAELDAVPGRMESLTRDGFMSIQNNCVIDTQLAQCTYDGMRMVGDARDPKDANGARFYIRPGQTLSCAVTWDDGAGTVVGNADPAGAQMQPPATGWPADSISGEGITAAGPNIAFNLTHSNFLYIFNLHGVDKAQPASRFAPPPIRLSVTAPGPGHQFDATWGKRIGADYLAHGGSDDDPFTFDFGLVTANKSKLPIYDLPPKLVTDTTAFWPNWATRLEWDKRKVLYKCESDTWFNDGAKNASASSPGTQMNADALGTYVYYANGIAAIIFRNTGYNDTQKDILLAAFVQGGLDSLALLFGGTPFQQGTEQQYMGRQFFFTFAGWMLDHTSLDATRLQLTNLLKYASWPRNDPVHPGLGTLAGTGPGTGKVLGMTFKEQGLVFDTDNPGNLILGDSALNGVGSPPVQYPQRGEHSKQVWFLGDTIYNATHSIINTWDNIHGAAGEPGFYPPSFDPCFPFQYYFPNTQQQYQNKTTGYFGNNIFGYLTEHMIARALGTEFAGLFAPTSAYFDFVNRWMELDNNDWAIAFTMYIAEEYREVTNYEIETQVGNSGSGTLGSNGYFWKDVWVEFLKDLF